MSFTYEQKIKGKVYVYKIESYWDKDKKQARQKRTYLGRKDEVTGEVKAKSKKIPVASYSVGSLHLLQEVIKKSKLLKVLKKVFPKDFEKILYLSCFKIIKKEPYYFYNFWCEDSYLSKENHLSSQELSRFLSMIGKNELSIELFFKTWIEEFQTSGAILFDITSISSYGAGNEFLERGYNRDKENLEQVKLGLITRVRKDAEPGIPLAYRIYPASITDVTTLSHITKFMRSYKLSVDVLVMDKGFYSQKNIKDMSLKGLKYILPLSFTTSLSKKILKDSKHELLSPEAPFIFYDQVYSYSQKKVKIGGRNCIAHIFLDKRRKVEEESKFIKKISDIEEIFLKEYFLNKDEALDFLKETLSTKKDFFIMKKENKKFKITRNLKVFKEEIMKMGCFILISNDSSLERDTVLELYRRKDSVEKVFLSFKHDVNEKRSRTHSLKAMRGSLFINFISLILIAWIDHVMKEKNLYKKIRKAELYKILDRLKLYKLANGETMMGEVSKKQRDILKAFGLKAHMKAKYEF